jgi:predicted O-methyltransferase YrrM
VVATTNRPGPSSVHCAPDASLGWAATEEAGISADQATLAKRAKDYTEAWLGEDEALLSARKRGQEIGAVPIGPGGGAMLRFLAATIAARAVVEIGTGAGVSGIYLLRGMPGDGVLTSIDLEGEHQRVAKESFVEAEIPSGRARLITGRALDVLPRLTDGGYDLVFCDANKAEYADYLREALRLLRRGGVVAFDNALWHGRVPDPSNRDSETVAVRELLRQVHDDERLTPVLLSAGDGLLAAVKGA